MGIGKMLKKVIVFHLILNVLFACFITASSYYHIPLNSFEGRFMYFIHLCVVQSTFAGILYFITLYRPIFKVLFSLLFVSLGVTAFWIYSINISVSDALIEATLSTKLYIIKDLISARLVVFFIILLAVLWGVLKFYKKIDPKKGASLFLPVSLCLIALFFYADYKRSHSFSSKLPYALFYSISDYCHKESISLKKPLVQKNASFSKLKTVLVIGESVRADHLGLNGYYRQTTPKLSERKNIISLNNIYTDKTNTSLSLPCILTDQSILSKKQDSLSSIFDIYNSLKIPTYWIGNQLLEKSYKPIVETNQNIEIIDKYKSYWSTDKKQDLSLLPSFIKKIHRDEYGLYSLHMIGSHWWYEDKYTNEYRKYKPIIDGKYIPSLTKAQIVNSYDNTILYLDAFLDSVIKVLEKENTPSVLIYISDHGESLGENGRWLHSHTEALTNPAMVIWFSNSFKEKFPEKIISLLENKNQKLSTDIIFHSLIDILNTDNTSYNTSESIFCKL